MANFTTHIGVGTVVAGALATLTLAADVVAPQNLVAVTLAGVVGSVLPDIDLKDSRPSKAIFAGLGILMSFAVLFEYATRYSIAELWLVWLGALVGIRYGLHAVFHRLSVHRGIWHSLLAALFSAVMTAVVFYHVLRRPDGVAWLAGGFMFIGYLVHLALDEIYSVDVMDTRIKSSFGTAIKVFDRRYPYASAGMAAALVLVALVSPPAKTFNDAMSSQAMWSGLQSRMLPQGGAWFGIKPQWSHGGTAHAGAASVGAPITTGSLPEPAGGIAPPATSPAPAAMAPGLAPAAAGSHRIITGSATNRD